MLEITKISKRYGAMQVLRDVSLRCERGEAVCLAGANAAGKTTLLTIAAGLQKADSGVVQADGKMGFVPQEGALLEQLSVKDNLRLWYAAANLSVKPLGEDSPERLFGLLPYAGKRVSKLSGGMKKRVSIACALAGNPDYLVLDEPFTALDLPSRTEILTLLCRLKEQGTGVLFSSHDQTAIAGVADRLLVLEEGAVRCEVVLASKTDVQTRTEQIISALSRV